MHDSPKLEQQVLWWLLPHGKRAIRVIVTINNCSEVLLKLSEGFTWIQQIEPLLPQFDETLKIGTDPVKKNETEIEWPLIAERDFFKQGKMEIEPAENDQIICDFIIESAVKKILIYSHIENESKTTMSWLDKLNTDDVSKDEEKTVGAGIGWNVSTIFDFSEQQVK